MLQKNIPLLHQIYFKHAGAGNGSSPDSALPFTDKATGVLTLDAGTVVEKISVVVTTELAGTTAVLVGDATDPDGFVAAADVTEGTVGAYVGAGAYLASGAIKYYAQDTELAFDFTGTSTAGACVVVVQGYRV